jgi:cellobiose PTS system EIIC component
MIRFGRKVDMSNLQEKTNGLMTKMAPTLNKIAKNKYLQAISGGMMGTLPITIIGSIACLLVVFPIKAVQNFIGFLGIGSILMAAYNLTLGGLAIYVAFLLAKNLVQQFLPDEDGATAGIAAVLSMFIVTPLGTLEDGGVAIPTTWLGAQGVFSAMIIGIIAGRIYVMAKQKGWTIKMPASVPPMVMKTFEGLIPNIVTGIFFIIIARLFELTSFGSMHQAIYTLLQQPFTNIGGSFPAMLLVCIFAQLLWFFGIHGTNVTMPFVQAIWLAMDVANLDATMAGTDLPNIIGYGFFMTVTFGGTALGLVVNMLLSKSKQYRQLGKMALVPALFGITEPVIFGTPLVMNFKFAFPFIFNNAIVLCIAYALTVTGIVPRFMGTSYVFGLPIGFSAAIQGSIMIVFMQLAVQTFTILLWRPFFKLQEKEALMAEEAMKAEN